MKCISVFLLASAVLAAADVPVDFMTGQAARAVIGQATFTTGDPNSSDTVLGAASGLAYAADTLFVADSNRVSALPSNNRVLLFQNLSSMLPSPDAELPYDSKCPVCVGRATVVLGQPDFTTTTENIPATQSNMRLATAVASDGVHVAVADTNHNRVLIWNRIPNTNDAPADVVVGQTDFTGSGTLDPPTASSLRGPQGVWIQNGKLYIADTQNNRILVYNQIPTKNGAAADMVLGTPNFTTSVVTDITAQTTATATNMLNPVSVTTDGTRLFVTDLGYNRVLVWRALPTSNDAPADFALGQPDLTSSTADYGYSTDPNDSTGKETPVLCTVSNGTDTNSNPTYPARCNSTLNFPRFALSTGTRLFVADGGGNRVMVYDQMPDGNGAAADSIIGQLGGTVTQALDAADSLNTPMSLAWDGTNLYVSDAYNRRITVYSIGENGIPYGGVRNAASLDIKATGGVAISGTIQAGDQVEITIDTTADTTTDKTAAVNYTYTVLSSDTLDTVLDGLVAKIQTANSGAGDPNVFAAADHAIETVLLVAKASGAAGNNVTYSVTVTPASGASAANITGTAAGSALLGGGDAASIAPGSVVSILGSSLSSATAAADLTQKQLPTQLANTEVYFNGIRSPLLYVSPTQVNAQLPWEVSDTTSVNAWVRSVQSDGSVVTTTPVAVTIVPANPGIYAQATQSGQALPAGIVVHGSSYAIGIVSVDGSITAGDTATVTVEDRTYNYTVQGGDTLVSVRDALIALINQDPQVTASPSGVFTRILLQAKVQGPDGNGITYSGTNTGNILITAFGTTTCCANVAGSPVTTQNPAIPGETIVVYATGLGLPVNDPASASGIATGMQYPKEGPITTPLSAVNATAGGKTADVIQATLMPGMVGMYQVLLHLNSSMDTDPFTQLTIAQDTYVSNVVTLPISNPGTTPSQ